MNPLESPNLHILKSPVLPISSLSILTLRGFDIIRREESGVDTIYRINLITCVKDLFWIKKLELYFLFFKNYNFSHLDSCLCE